MKANKKLDSLLNRLKIRLIQTNLAYRGCDERYTFLSDGFVIRCTNNTVRLFTADDYKNNDENYRNCTDLLTEGEEEYLITKGFIKHCFKYGDKRFADKAKVDEKARKEEAKTQENKRKALLELV